MLPVETLQTALVGHMRLFPVPVPILLCQPFTLSTKEEAKIEFCYHTRRFHTLDTIKGSRRDTCKR